MPAALADYREVLRERLRPYIEQVEIRSRQFSPARGADDVVAHHDAVLRSATAGAIFGGGKHTVQVAEDVLPIDGRVT